MEEEKKVADRCVGMYVIYDRLAEEAGPIFHARNDAVAYRSYDHHISTSRLNPDEYDLYYVGLYNAEIMLIKPNAPLKVQRPQEVKIV